MKESPIAVDEDEEKLLSMFRKLTTEMKAVVLAKIKQFLDVDGSLNESNPPIEKGIHPIHNKSRG
jgi:hypothetical protein